MSDADLQAVSVAADGTVSFNGDTYSLSGAGRAAKISVRGPDAPASVVSTDGWGFWQMKDADGGWVTLDRLRRQFVAQRERS